MQCAYFGTEPYQVLSSPFSIFCLKFARYIHILNDWDQDTGKKTAQLIATMKKDRLTYHVSNATYMQSIFPTDPSVQVINKWLVEWVKFNIPLTTCYRDACTAGNGRWEPSPHFSEDNLKMIDTGTLNIKANYHIHCYAICIWD